MSGSGMAMGGDAEAGAGVIGEVVGGVEGGGDIIGLCALAVVTSTAARRSARGVVPAMVSV